MIIYVCCLPHELFVVVIRSLLQDLFWVALTFFNGGGHSFCPLPLSVARLASRETVSVKGYGDGRLNTTASVNHPLTKVAVNKLTKQYT